MSKARVTILADDAIRAMTALRSNVERMMERNSDSEVLREILAENRESYERIAKALGLKPTLSVPSGDERR